MQRKPELSEEDARIGIEDDGAEKGGHRLLVESMGW